MKQAIVVGRGGIGMNVYIPQLEKLGYHVTTVDPNLPANYSTVNDVPKTDKYDIAIVCCPNVHHLNAVLELSDVCPVILVEKPGLANSDAWRNTIQRFPHHRIIMVKNNLYRRSIDAFTTIADNDDLEKIEINWLNADRIPNPGGWFTNSEMAFGGVTHDLFPHLYCFMFAMVGWQAMQYATAHTFDMQRWNLDTLGDSTDYGKIDKTGTYDVCDYAEAHYLLPRTGNTPLAVSLRASWKEGHDDQGVHLYFKDGRKIHLETGLCPDEAYGRMIEDVMNNKFMGDERQTWIEEDFDLWIHMQLEGFK